MIAVVCTISPPIASLCIRSGCVLGVVKDKHILHENGGDQYVGKRLNEFSVLSSYFDFQH